MLLVAISCYLQQSSAGGTVTWYAHNDHTGTCEETVSSCRYFALSVLLWLFLIFAEEEVSSIICLVWFECTMKKGKPVRGDESL